MIEKFPTGLLSHSGLEYSGIYEDGWISRESFVKLGPSRQGESTIVEDMDPRLGNLGNRRLRVKVQINASPPRGDR